MKELNPFWKLLFIGCSLFAWLTPAYADRKLDQLQKQALTLGQIQNQQKQELRQRISGSGCEKNEIQFDNIKVREKSGTSVVARNANCPAGAAEVVKLERQLQNTTKQILINRLEANHRRFEIKSADTSDKQAYLELSNNIKQVLSHDVMKTLDPKTKDEVRKIANQFLDKAKNAKAEAGLSTCTDCGVSGPIQELANAIKDLKKK